MEFFRMYYILLNLFIVAIKVSEAADVEFKGTEPKIVLAGGNVTFRWLYTGDKTPEITEFVVAGEDLLYYRLTPGGKPKSEPAVQKYAAAVNWTGNISRNEHDFTLVDVKEDAHGKNFSVKITTNDFKTHYGFAPLSISVPPEGIELLIDKTNVTVSDRVTMECRVKNKGRPTAKISWYHNNKLVPEGNNAQYLYSKKEIEINDAGPYRCVAKNEAAEIKSKVRYIDVRTKEDEDVPTAGKSSGGLGGGAVAGIVVAILIVIIIILIGVVVLVKKKGRTPKSSKSKTVNGDEGKSMVPPQEKDQVWL